MKRIIKSEAIQPVPPGRTLSTETIEEFRGPAQNTSGMPSSRNRTRSSRPCSPASWRSQRGGSSISSNDNLNVP